MVSAGQVHGGFLTVYGNRLLSVSEFFKGECMDISFMSRALSMTIGCQNAGRLGYKGSY